MEEEQKAVCNECQLKLDEAYGLPLEKRKPCSGCGSLNRTLQINLSETIEVHGSVKLVHKDSEGKKLTQIQSGDDLHRDTNTWRSVERVIDWGKKWYTETIRDLLTGRVIKQTSEDLRQHSGHGSAKK